MGTELHSGYTMNHIKINAGTGLNINASKCMCRFTSIKPLLQMEADKYIGSVSADFKHLHWNTKQVNDRREGEL